jgi:hypothetical protein
MYYFTFGVQSQLYEGGWVRINANNLDEAQDKFIARYGDRAYRRPGVLNYAFAYKEADFQTTMMSRKGSLGAFEREYID